MMGAAKPIIAVMIISALSAQPAHQRFPEIGAEDEDEDDPGP